jgi:sugar phosphate isomerase/epimerase
LSRLGVAHLTALDLAPLALVRAAGGAGFGSVGLRLHPAMAGGIAYPLAPGSAALKQLRGALDGEGVVVNEIEFIELTPEVNISSFASLLETGAVLGARSLTVSGDDPDPSRLADNFAGLCRLASGYGLRVELEFMRWRQVANLQQAVVLVAAADQDNGGVLIDALHLFRSGSSAAALAQVDPRYVRAVQWCDAPLLAPPEALIIREAREGRLLPGDGQLPLAELFAALPADIHCSVEAPSPDPDKAAHLRRTCSVTAAWLAGQRLHP